MRSKLSMTFVQLSLTIVYIAGGVFVSGWIGKLTFALNDANVIALLCPSFVNYNDDISCHHNQLIFLCYRGVLLDTDWREADCCDQVKVCPSTTESGYEFL